MENHIENIEKVFTSLHAIKEPIEVVLNDSGPVFEQIGTELQLIYTGAKELNQLNVEAASMVDGDSDTNSLSQIGGLANESLKMLESSREDIGKGIENVQTSANHLVNLRSKTSVIKRISKTLNIVALNIAMESTRSMECEEMFSFFVSEIKALSKNVNAITLSMHEDAASAYQKQMDAFGDISTQKMQLASLADTAHEVVQDNISKIEQLVASSLNAMNMAGIHSEKISRQVGEVVVAIQFHDIARQQLEHVIEAFDDAEKLCEKGTGTSVSEDQKAEILDQVYSIFNLQSAQMNLVINEIGDSHKKIAKAFDEIGNEADQLVNRVMGLGLIGIDETGERSCFSDLISGLEHLDNIMEQGHGMAHKVEETMLESTETVAKLSDHIKQIEGISMDLHIKAINAVLMSMRLGKKGKTLAVLAQDVTAVSKESNEFVAEVVDIIKEIGSIAHDLKCLTSRANDESSETGVVSESSLTQGVENISNAYEQFKENASGAIERSKELKEKIVQTESGLSFVIEIIEQLIEGRKRIDSLVQLLKPFSLAENRDDSGIEYVSERYTMESERHVHEQALGQTGLSIDHSEGDIFEEDSFETGDFSETETVMPSEAESENVREDSEFDENVELF